MKALGLLLLSSMLGAAAPLEYLWARGAGGAGLDQAKKVGVDNTVPINNLIGGATSAPAILPLVNSPPVILAQPESQTALPESSVIFRVWAGGTALRFQWLFNGQELAGATNAILSLTNVQPRHAGQYTVLIRGAYGVITSVPATLAVEVLPPFVWALALGGPGGAEEAESLAVDTAGNVYVTGYFGDISSFGGINLDAGSSANIFVAKFAPNGQVIWAHRAGSTNGNWNIGNGLGLDQETNVYVAGYFTGSADFGPTNLISRGGADIFLAKYDQAGHFLWVRQDGGPSDDLAQDLAIGPNNEVYVSGEYHNPVVFGSNTFTSAGSFDMFLARYDGSGNCVWAQHAGSPGWDSGTTLAVDSAGNVFVSGDFAGPLQFTSGLVLSWSAEIDIYLAKFNSNGDLLWATNAGGTSSDRPYGLAATSEGDVYLTGYYGAPCSFGDKVLTNSWRNMFLARYSGAGELRWVFAGDGTDSSGMNVAVDPTGCPYVIGLFNSTRMSFGNTNLLASSNIGEVFLVKFDPMGHPLWARQAGGTNHDVGIAVALSQCGEIFVAGTFGKRANFGYLTLTSSGDYDMYLAKLNSSTILAPKLTLTRSGQDLLLSWSAFSSGFRLESTTNLTTSFSTNLLNPPIQVIQGTNWMVFPGSAIPQYFRLNRP